MQQFANYLRAAYPALWVSTLEPERAERELAVVAYDINKVPAQRWDIEAGMEDLVSGKVSTCATPKKALEMASQAPPGTVTFLWNLHRFLNSPDVIQAIQNIIPKLKDPGGPKSDVKLASAIVVLAPSANNIPPELQRVFTVMDIALPDKESLASTITKLAEPPGVKAPKGLALSNAADAALGLTAAEAEDAFALSLVEKKQFDPSVIAREKANALLRHAHLELNTYDERFDNLGGLDVLKDYTLKTALSPLSLGLLMLGVPGVGKSHFAKALGNELGIPTLSMDFGQMMTGIVGASEQRMRDALAAVDAMGRVLLFIDELGEGLAGVRGSGELDSGVKAGVAGTFLKWMSDREPGRAYVIATTNQVDRIPPQYLRSERWDALFFIDLPHQDEKDAIWDIYLKKYGFEGARRDGVPDSDWTGAEIKSCCRTAAMMDVSLAKASEYIVPVTKSMHEEIVALREWGAARCIMASAPDAPKQAKRRIRQGG